MNCLLTSNDRSSYVVGFGATACERSFPSISSASFLGYFTSCRPGNRGRHSGLLKVPNKPNKSLVLHHAVLTRSVDTAKRKKELDQYHASQMLLNLYKCHMLIYLWRYTFLMSSQGHMLKQFLPFRVQYDFLENLRCYADSMLGQLHMYIRDIGSFLVP